MHVTVSLAKAIAPLPALRGTIVLFTNARRNVRTPASATASPRTRIVNLETAATTSDEPWPGKGIHDRMHPANIALLSAAGLDVCALGNNRVMDWERTGLRETLSVLRRQGMAAAVREGRPVPCVVTKGRLESASVATATAFGGVEAHPALGAWGEWSQ